MYHWLRSVLYSFVVLLILRFVLTLGGQIKRLGTAYDALFQPLVGWVGKYLLGLGNVVRIAPNGSGDTLYNWVHQLTLLLLAVILGSVIAVRWKSRSGYRRWHAWLVVLSTVFLSAFMMLYGFAKVFPNQFGQRSLTSLYENYGQSSPMRLLWTFMSYSRPYTVFTGLLEVVAGILLIPRYTRTVGALLAVGIMANVLMLNLSYDVPVKIFSAQLLGLALFIAAADRHRLLQFIRNRPVRPRSFPQLTHSVRANRILSFGKYGLLLLICALSISINWNNLSKMQPSLLYGVYEVTSVLGARSAGAKDVPQWKRIIFDHAGRVSVILADGSHKSFPGSVDPEAQTIRLDGHRTGKPFMMLTYARTGSGIVLRGTSFTKGLEIVAEEVDVSGFIINRGLNWVNERPYNRYAD